MPQQNERRTDPNTGESRIWNGSRWEQQDVQPVSPNEPDTYMGGFVKGGLQSLGESKGRLAALGGLLGTFVGAPNVGAMAGTEIGNLAEKAGGGDNTLMGDAARVATVGASGWGLGKIFQGGQYLANKAGLPNAALTAASYLPVVGKYARLAKALGAGEAGAGAEAGAAAESSIPGMTAAEVKQMAAKGYSPETLTRMAEQNAPRPAMPAKAPVTAGGGARPRLSTPAAPYTQGPEQMPNLLQEPTMNLDRLSGEAAERIPSVNRSELPNIGGKTIMPNLSKTPTLKYGADVETAGDWHTPAAAPEAAPVGAGPVEGLKAATPDSEAAGLEKWISGGGTPESYLRAKGALQGMQGGGVEPNFSQGTGPEGFGPNTVGAAEAPKWLPKTVDEAKGLSLAEQEAWASYKAANPGVTDGMLNSWYTSHQLGGDPNEGLDVNAMADKLTELLRAKKP